MFGHDDSNSQPQDNSSVAMGTDDGQPQPPQMSTPDGSAYAVSAPAVEETSEAAEQPAADTTQVPAVETTPMEITDTSAPTEPAATASLPIDKDDLLDLKQEALAKLAPLVDQLEQTAEEKFRTTMMMIQASDNDSLIKTAYEAALEIEDEKSRAQALLDIVNEINYFTQQQGA
jgi:hypothetical protein